MTKSIRCAYRAGAAAALAIMLIVAAPAMAKTDLSRDANNPSMLENFNFDHPTFVHKLPDAKQNIVIQISKGGPDQWHMYLHMVQNVLEFFGDGKARIVVVAYGPGLKMLLANSPVASRIESLDARRVEFDACHNSMVGMSKKLGHLPKLVPEAVIVPSGLVRITQLEHAGFDYIKP
ncbi:MAG: hypothetical protein WBL23_18315 [Salinisphaera sp.]|uniref:DsrE family protein n=1 Tax=Salinisphaera sp. TaxID=1914330 RepID=UPI003C7D9C34